MVKETNNRSLIFLLPNFPQLLQIFYDSPIKYYFSPFGFMIPRLCCLYISQKALFHKYFMATKYRCICKILILNESPPLVPCRCI